MNAHGAMYVAMRMVSTLSLEKGIELIMQPSKTVEVRSGWVFFYTSVNSARTGLLDEKLLNSGPILVRRDGSTELLPATIQWQELEDEAGTI